MSRPAGRDTDLGLSMCVNVVFVFLFPFGVLGGFCFVSVSVCSSLPLLWKLLGGVVTEEIADAPEAPHRQSLTYLDTDQPSRPLRIVVPTPVR